MDYNVKLHIGEFHLVFGAIQDKVISNKDKMESMVSYNYDNDPFEQIISNSERYEELKSQNAQLNALADRLYKETDEQLKARNINK